MTISDAAMVCARAAVAKVAFSSSQSTQIAKAEQALADVEVMAGANHLRFLSDETLKKKFTG